MNIAMEETTEHVDGVLKSNYGDTFIRGNNGMCHDAASDISGLYITALDA